MIFCETALCPHEAQHGKLCRWCYDREWARRKNKTKKVAKSEENEMLALIEDVVQKIPARSFKKGLK